MIEPLRARKGWQLGGVLLQADRALAVVWMSLLVLRGLLPAIFAIAMGALVGAVQRGGSLSAPLSVVGIVFVLLQVLAPVHQAVGANLGSRTAAWLYDRLTAACVRPPGMGHLESPRLTSDLTMARDFDLGITGPPLFIAMDFVAAGLVEMIAGLASAVVLAAYAWWAPLVLAGAWLATHWLLRESAVWRDRNTEEVREAQRHADYAFRLAVDPPAAKELRLFGLADWTVERFRARRRRLHELRWHATRLRERPVVWSLLLVVAANVAVFWSLGAAAAGGGLPLARLVTFASAAASTSMIAFGGLSWALDGAAAPAAAVLRLQPAMAVAGALPSGELPAVGLPAREIRFRHVTFAYPAAGDAPNEPVLAGFDLTIPAGSSLAIVGQNGAGKTTLAKLLCRLYDVQDGAIEVDGVDLRSLDLDGWRSRVTAVFQDFIRFELPLRDNVAPAGAPDAVIEAALAEAGASGFADLGTIL
ncbi:MAG TPA: ABC transporter ATP-binding protein, partial [Thermoanaerobaculia bacterium]|nr:ABC transporter ATP-binding protein [Thermoanaerobaculia bacterium]